MPYFSCTRARPFLAFVHRAQGLNFNVHRAQLFLDRKSIGESGAGSD